VFIWIPTPLQASFDFLNVVHLERSSSRAPLERYPGGLLSDAFTFRNTYGSAREFFEITRHTLALLAGELPILEPTSGVSASASQHELNLPLGPAELILHYAWGPHLCPSVQGNRGAWSDEYGAPSERTRAERVRRTEARIKQTIEGCKSINQRIHESETVVEKQKKRRERSSLASNKRPHKRQRRA
jgi:hypothetical protein